jgi:hypothetical protein
LIISALSPTPVFLLLMLGPLIPDRYYFFSF